MLKLMRIQINQTKRMQMLQDSIFLREVTNKHETKQNICQWLVHIQRVVFGICGIHKCQKRKQARGKTLQFLFLKKYILHTIVIR